MATEYVCVTCGTQFDATEVEPESCPICTDPRQYLPEGGQQWTTLEALRETHRNEIREEAGLVGVGMEPSFAIGQRGLLVPFGESNVLWDCVTLIDEAAAEQIQGRGGLAGIAISHPHYYSGMVEWARRFECPIHLHADDAQWIMHPDPAVELWQGETKQLGQGLTLIRCGGHFKGGTVLHVGDRLLSGDIVQVIPDRGHVSFMWSYPNLVPLPETSVRRIVAALEPFEFATIHGAWWGRLVPADGKEIVRRSAARYLRALREELG